MLNALADLLQPWSDLYNGSVAVENVVMFGHLAGILVAGGFAVATDRAVLRAGRAVPAARAHVVRELGHIHRPVLVGLAVVILTGIAMLLSDVQTFLPSWVFWLKMGLFVLLLANGLVLERAGQRLEAKDMEEPDMEAPDGPGWRRLRNASLRSGGLWVLTLLFGVLLTGV
jgi:hypothetical protein